MTNQKAILPSEAKSRSGCLKYVAIFFGILLISATCTQLEKRHECVEMPNGFLIGRATVFSRMIGWGPDIAIKYPDGRLFLRGDKTMHFWDEDSFAGELEDTPEGRTNSYVYVNGVGLIRQLEQPELYQQYFDRKMRLHRNNRNSRGGHVNRTYLILYHDPNEDEGVYFNPDSPYGGNGAQRLGSIHNI